MITVFSFVRSFFSSSCYVCLEAANGACDAIVASAALSLSLSLSLLFLSYFESDFDDSGEVNLYHRMATNPVKKAFSSGLFANESVFSDIL